jgi:hypothetical protein
MEKEKEYFIRKYKSLHVEIHTLETEIENYIKNKKDLLCDEHKLLDLKKKVVETIELLNKTREDEKRIFNY